MIAAAANGTAPKALHPSAQRVQDALVACGLDTLVVELPRTTRTAREAAEAIGCRVEQIAKSLLFQRAQSGDPVLVIASGRNRVDESRLEVLLGEPLLKPDAAYVRSRTGYVIGGVPPIAHAEPLETFVDEDLLALDELWAAAGTPNAVFRLTPSDLLRLTGGRVAVIA